jgi:predicted nucleic acid-binding protein
LSVFVDTSVWSLAFRRDAPSSAAEVRALIQMIEARDTIVTTGLVLQELLQGFLGPKDRAQILSRFSEIPLLMPDREDHIAAAQLRNICRRAGAQVGTIDALLAQLCIRYDLIMLSSDEDFSRIAQQSALKVWREHP